MSFLALPNEIVLFLASFLCTADVNSLLQVNHGLEWLLTPLLYDRTSLPSEPAQPTRLQEVLRWASERGYEKPINLLLDRGAKPISSCYRYGQTPLHLATQNGHIRTITLFMRRSPTACMELLTETVYGPRLLNTAAWRGHQDIVRLLIPHADHTHLLSALSIAAGCGNVDIVELLLPHVDCTQLCEPLKEAATQGRAGVAALLLSHVDIEHQPKIATAALEGAVKGGHEDVLDVLVAARCNVNIEIGHPSKQKALHWLCNFACWMALVKDRPADNIAVTLLVNGADATEVGHGGRTPLHIATRHGPHVTHRTLGFLNPLSTKEGLARSITMDRVHRSLLQLLVQAGADINARDDLGRTPLHEAAENSDELAVTTLLDLGAETMIVDHRGNMALELAEGFLERDGAAAVICAIGDHEVAMSRAWMDVSMNQ